MCCQAKLLGVLMVINGCIVVNLIGDPIITIRHTSIRHVDSLKYSKNWVRGPVLVKFSLFLSVYYNLFMVSELTFCFVLGCLKQMVHARIKTQTLRTIKFENEVLSLSYNFGFVFCVILTSDH